jgi:hypothetical protein
MASRIDSKERIAVTGEYYYYIGIAGCQPNLLNTEVDDVYP